MNFGCLLKLFFFWKCLHANMVLGWGFFTSFLWLFSRILKSVCLSYILFYITCIPLNIWHTRCNNQLHEKSYIFFESVDFWKLMLLWLSCGTEFCYFQNTGNISLVSKCFCLFSSQCCFRFCCCRWVPWDFFYVWKL